MDFDATDDRIHGDQIGRSFHGYYGRLQGTNIRYGVSLMENPKNVNGT